jgi:hypothetical protein
MAVRRESVVRVLLPSLVVGAVYAALWLGPSLRRQGELERKLEEAERSAPTAAQLAQAAGVQSQAARQAGQLKEEAEGLRAGLLAPATALGLPGRRAATIEALVRMGAVRGLRVIEESVLAQERPPAFLLPVPRDRVVPRSAVRGEGSGRVEAQPQAVRTPGLWRVVVAGRYADVVGFLEDVGASGASVMPWSVSLDEAPVDGGAGRWTIWLWV